VVFEVKVGDCSCEVMAKWDVMDRLSFAVDSGLYKYSKVDCYDGQSNFHLHVKPMTSCG
jgi:hypothetical protein